MRLHLRVHGRRGAVRYFGVMPVRLSRRVARFNRVVNNPIQLRYAWLLPPWAVIHHHGRRAGRPYRTPVAAYKRGSVLAVVILYGEDSDWIQNLLAAGGSGSVQRAGRRYAFTGCRVVPVASSDPILAAVSPVARVAGRMSGRLLVGELAPVPRGGD